MRAHRRLEMTTAHLSDLGADKGRACAYLHPSSPTLETRAGRTRKVDLANLFARDEVLDELRRVRRSDMQHVEDAIGQSGFLEDLGDGEVDLWGVLLESELLTL